MAADSSFLAGDHYYSLGEWKGLVLSWMFLRSVGFWGISFTVPGSYSALGGHKVRGFAPLRILHQDAQIPLQAAGMGPCDHGLNLLKP